MKGYNNYQIQMNVSLTPAVKFILSLQVIVWLSLVVLLQGFILKNNFVFQTFGLSASGFFSELLVYQPFTYMFLHSGDIWHILFNSLIIWFIGSELEKIWGVKEFLKFYLVCGVGAGLVYVLSVYSLVEIFHLNPGHLSVPTVGASGAVFGLLVAYGVIFSDRMIYFMMLFPMKAKYFVMLLGAVELFTVLTSGIGGKVNNLAHLGGFLVGFVYLFVQKRLSRMRQDKWFKKPGRKLKLVVDNDHKKDNGPTYH